jgi:hypothetical protein
MTAHDPELIRSVLDQRTLDLERDDAARKALDDAANALEMLGGADQYQRAYRKAADFLRAFRWRPS